MKLYQEGSYYADIVKSGRALEFWIALLCYVIGPFALIALSAVVGAMR